MRVILMYCEVKLNEITFNSPLQGAETKSSSQNRSLC